MSKFCLPPKTCVQVSAGTLLETLRPSQMVETALRHSSVGVRWTTGVKCNFSSAHHHVRKIVVKLPIRRVRMWTFTRLGPKRKKLWLLIVPVQRPSEQPGLGPPPKEVWTATFLRRNSTSRTALESSQSRTLKYAVSAWLAKRWKNYSSFKILP